MWQQALDHFLDNYYTAQAQNLRVVAPTAEDLNGHSPEQTRVFEIAGIDERFGQWREQLLHDFESILGPERLSLLQEALQGWMSIHDEMRMVSGDMAVLEFGRRERFYQPAPGSGRITWGFIKSDHSGGMQASMGADEIPALYRPYLLDWIRSAQARPTAPTDPAPNPRP